MRQGFGQSEQSICYHGRSCTGSFHCCFKTHKDLRGRIFSPSACCCSSRVVLVAAEGASDTSSGKATIDLQLPLLTCSTVQLVIDVFFFFFSVVIAALA